MPTVDFTKAELLGELREMMHGMMYGMMHEEVPGIVREVLRKEFKPLFDDAFEPYAMAIQQDFVAIHARLDRLEHDSKRVGRL